MGQPLFRLFGLNPTRIPMTSFTIAMDSPEIMAQRARDAGFPIIKVKLGSADDGGDRCCDSERDHLQASPGREYRMVQGKGTATYSSNG